MCCRVDGAVDNFFPCTRSLSYIDDEGPGWLADIGQPNECINEWKWLGDPVHWDGFMPFSGKIHIKRPVSETHWWNKARKEGKSVSLEGLLCPLTVCLDFSGDLLYSYRLFQVSSLALMPVVLYYHSTPIFELISQSQKIPFEPSRPKSVLMAAHSPLQNSMRTLQWNGGGFWLRYGCGKTIPRCSQSLIQSFQ